MKNKPLSWLMARIKTHIPRLVLLTVLNVLQALSGVAIAVQSKRMLDLATAAVKGPWQNFLRAALILAAFVLAFIALRFWSAHLRETLNILLDRDWKKKLLSRLLHGRFTDVKAYHSGELVNRLSADVKSVDDGIVSVIPGFAAMGARFIAATVALFVLAPVLTLILLGAGIFIVLVTTAFRRLLKDLHKKVSASNGKANGFLQEAIEKLLMIQSMDVSNEMEKRAGAVFDERAAVQKKQRNLSVLGMSGLSLVMSVLYYGSLIFMAVELLQGHITVGTMTAVTQLVGQMQNPIANLSSVLQAYIGMLGSAERLRELYEIPAEESGEAVPEELLKTPPVITAKDLSFKYPDEEAPVFSGLSFEIPSGSFAAVAGESGIGKSTLLKLMLGVYDADSGTLKAGERAISRATRRFFSYVPQGNLLLSGTLRENILLTDPDATEETLQNALYVSDLEEFTSSLPNGLDTVIGESGAGISEGQAERIAIARAILRNAPVILLDEATSALDPETEERVLDRIKALPGKTVIAVTHRPYAKTIADVKVELLKE